VANEDQNKQGAPAASDGAEAAPQNSGRRRIILIVVVVLLAVGGFFYWMHSRQFEDTDDAQVDGNLYQVSSRVSGQVIKVYVEDQQFVHQGDPIADVDPRDYQVALEQAQANLANAQAEYQEAVSNVPITNVNVRTNITTSGQDVSGAQAAVSQAEAQAQAAVARVQAAKANALKAQLDVDRYTPLVKNDVISKQQYDAAVATATADQASLDEAERNVRAQQDQVSQAEQKLADSRTAAQQNTVNGPKLNQVQAARAEAALAAVKQSQAKVDQAQLNLGYTKIVAPTDGIVSKKSVVVGNNLSIGQDLLTLVPLTDLWVTANFKETQLGHMQQGQPVEIKVDALGGRTFRGKITQVGGATGSKLSLFPPENATGNYVKVVQRIPVRVDFTNLKDENKDYALRPGMSVEPTVTVR
jgi:membrane fusion protein (multidrug efflux system)